MRHAVVVSICALFCAPGLRAECDVARLSASLYKVEVESTDGSAARGSAVPVAPDRLLTNCHVTRQARRIDIVQPGRRWHATLAARDTEHDLCLLAVEGIHADPVSLVSSDGLHVGTQVCAAGFPHGGPLAVSEGRIEALHPYDHARVIQTSAAFNPGASGGGLFDQEGRMVGVLTFKAGSGGAYHFALPTEWAEALYAEAPTGAPRPGKEAFWERLGARQPNFMRAVALEAERNWRGLLDFARKWAKTDGSNPQCWISAALAHLHLREPHDASVAFQRAAAMDPDYAGTSAAAIAAGR